MNSKTLKQEIHHKIKELVDSNAFGFTEEDADYIYVDVTSQDEFVKAEVRTELEYDELMNLCDELNPIVSKIDNNAYFEPETSGIISAYLDKESLKEDTQQIVVVFSYPGPHKTMETEKHVFNSMDAARMFVRDYDISREDIVDVKNGSVEELFEAFEADIYDDDFYLDDAELLYDDEPIKQGKSFIEDGKEFTWVQREGDSLIIDFDHWGVWKAVSEDGEDAWFVVELDTGFIDWGPCETFEEASNFMMGKVDSEEDDLLTEAPITLNDDEINNPNTLSLKDVIRRNNKEEAEAKQAELVKAKEEKLKENEAAVLEIINSKEEPLTQLDKLFNLLVPSSGMCDSVAGELVRALVRIIYRDRNDGDKFFTGYGLETCGGSAMYLYNNGLDRQIDSIIEDGEALEGDDRAYSDAIDNLAGDLIDLIKNDTKLITTVNDIDSRSIDYSYIEDRQPLFEFEFYASDDVGRLVDSGALTSWNLNEYVRNILDYSRYTSGAEVERPWGLHDKSVTVSNLTRDGLDYCENDLFRDVESFWEDLVEEHRDELSSDDED